MTNYNKYYMKTITAIFFILAGAFAIGAAWFLQHVLHMVPCALCLLERWPYCFLIILGILGIFIPTRYLTLILWAGFMVLLMSIGISCLHIGVEQGWWASPLPECSANLVATDNLADRLGAMPDRPGKPCDVASYPFSWLPVSLTMVNGLYSLFLFAILIWRLVEERHNRRIYF